ALAAEQRAAAGQAQQRNSAAVRAALAEYHVGTIDAAALELALLAASVDPIIAGFAVAMADARLQGARVIVDGKLVARQDAQALRSQVAALKEQTVKKLIDPATALNALDALGIPGPNRNALVAAWAAQALKEILPV
ncbi:MAG: hypothetical protein ACRET2_13035, partial [Steroidobacteraceae bacterium]